jgi:hypothetical protein
MQTLFFSPRYNACYHLPAFVRPDVVVLPAYSGVMTMHKFLTAVAVSLLTLTCATQACAERNFPQQARRGVVKAYQYPSMKIGDHVYKLAAGSRIYNQQNMIIMPASLQLQTAPVMYLLDISGDLSRIWLLTDDEAARHPLPKQP